MDPLGESQDKKCLNWLVSHFMACMLAADLVSSIALTFTASSFLLLVILSILAYCSHVICC